MISRQRPQGFVAVLALTWALLLGFGVAPPVQAASEDVAMFYDDLSQSGQWAEYENYGAVWRPSQVPEDWRPYTNGRWVPTNNGYVFESQEPWGWATYHYGNWMPTEGQGWVWVPGRTWYPSTVEWRTSPESEPVETSYVGWAPIPPPNYVPPPGYAPASYYQGSPIVDLLTAPFWIFAKAASFLLGFGQPYAPPYSYITSGVLVPPAYVPVFYPQTVFVSNYFTPTYFPPAFYGVRNRGFAAYNWGPPVGYVSRVTNLNQGVINQAINYNSANITRINSVVAPRTVLNRYAYVNQIIPPALAQGRALPPPQQAQNMRMAQVNLYKPNMLPPPRQVPAIRAQFARLQPAAVAPGGGIPGTALPARATMPLTPQMAQQIQNLPTAQRFVPAKAASFTPAVATQPGQVQPGFQTRPGGVQTGVPAPTGLQAQPEKGPTGKAVPGEFHPGATRPGTTRAATPATPGATPPSGVALSPGDKGVTPEQRQQLGREPQRLQRGGTPGQSASKQQVQQGDRQWRQSKPPRDGKLSQPQEGKGQLLRQRQPQRDVQSRSQSQPQQVRQDKRQQKPSQPQ